MIVVQIGNFDPPHSTENELRKALEDNGCDVIAVQENMREAAAFNEAIMWARTQKAAFILWTRTGWDWPRFGCSVADAFAKQRHMLAAAKDLGVPVVGYHLDRWWGLSREHELSEWPFFEVDLLCTADGGHQAEFEAAGINHVWFPPAVSRFECQPIGDFKLYLAFDVNFVGSWQGGYHAEWKHRQQLVDHLGKSWSAKMWPARGEEAVRLEMLRNLYRSGRVFVGDSCLTPNADGSPAVNYCSDRVPETLGRWGFLIHPEVPGITTPNAEGYRMYEAGEHLVTWPLGDWDELDHQIEGYVNDDMGRLEIAEAGHHHTMAAHTYSARMSTLIELLLDRKMIR